jgi:hypothetical protein
MVILFSLAYKLAVKGDISVTRYISQYLGKWEKVTETIQRISIKGNLTYARSIR